jgi:FKBP-type peptidyl-prolyl cis-trans isomerase FklB
MSSLIVWVVLPLVTLTMCGCGSNAAAGGKPSAVGMTALPSGLQYRVLEAGTGATPKATDRVKVHYKGQFEDGKEFDSSYSRGRPAVFPVNGVIKGWTEALLLMKEGAKWQVCIPSDLGYGPSGMPPVIPPNATLYFDVELISIEK